MSADCLVMEDQMEKKIEERHESWLYYRVIALRSRGLQNYQHCVEVVLRA